MGPEDTSSPTTDDAGTIREIRRSRPRRGFLSQWPRHKGVRSGDQLTIGERAADLMRNGMGSWWFVFASVAYITVWMMFNRGAGFDPYPFILLNLTLSCLAAMQGAILLIAAKRSDQIASELAMSDYETDKRADERIQAVHDRIAEIAAHNQALLEQNTRLLEQVLAVNAAAPAAGEQLGGDVHG